MRYVRQAEIGRLTNETHRSVIYRCSVPGRGCTGRTPIHRQRKAGTFPPDLLPLGAKNRPVERCLLQHAGRGDSRRASTVQSV